jgi:hypothetical protein
MAKSDLFSKPNYNKYNFFNDEYRLMLKKPQLETELIDFGLDFRLVFIS